MRAGDRHKPAHPPPNFGACRRRHGGDAMGQKQHMTTISLSPGKINFPELLAAAAHLSQLLEPTLFTPQPNRWAPNPPIGGFSTLYKKRYMIASLGEEMLG